MDSLSSSKDGDSEYRPEQAVESVEEAPNDHTEENTPTSEKKPRKSAAGRQLMRWDREFSRYFQYR